MPDNTSNTTVSFADDVLPIFYRFKQQMMWRFDLTDYENVKTNYDLILNQISSKNMPPPPYDPLSDEQVNTFKAWAAGNFQP